MITRDRVERGKPDPDPDLFLAAAAELGIPITSYWVVGDSCGTCWPRNARALGIGVLSGGYGRDELERAGAYRLYDEPADLLRHLDEIGIRLGH